MHVASNLRETCEPGSAEHSVDPGADAPPATLSEPARARRWIGSFARGDSIDDVFVLRKLELRAPRGATPGNGKGAHQLFLELQDRTGTIAARHAPLDGALLDRLRATPYARARGLVVGAGPRDSGRLSTRTLDPAGVEGRGDREGTNELEVRLDALAPVHASEVRVRDLFEHTPEDPDALLAELRSAYETCVPGGFVRRLLLSFLDDPELVGKLRYAPAASSYHHSYVGGLLEHIASLTRLALNVCKTYPRLDVGLMLAGVFLHDLGKVDELGWERGLHYTDRGQLVGHIAIGVLLLEDKIRAIEGFPARLRDVLAHLILSHHGTREFGSPVVPATPEALALHHLDNLDGKLWSAWRAQDDPAGDREWSSFNRHLSRRIYRGGVNDRGGVDDGARADDPS